MFIKAKDTKLADTFYEELDSILINPEYQRNPQKVINVIDKCLKDVMETKQLLTGERKKLSDKDFFDSLMKVNYITFTKNDMYRVLNEVYQKNYIGYTTLLSYIYLGKEAGEDKFLGYIVLVSEDAVIDNMRLFTVQELRELIEAKQILIVDRLECTYDLDVPHEEEPVFDIIDLEYPLHNNDEIKECVYKYIRRNASSKRLAMVLRNYLINLENEIKNNLSIRDKLNYEESFTADCRNRLRKSGQMQRIRKLIKECEK